MARCKLQEFVMSNVTPRNNDKLKRAVRLLAAERIILSDLSDFDKEAILLDILSQDFDEIIPTVH